MEYLQEVKKHEDYGLSLYEKLSEIFNNDVFGLILNIRKHGVTILQNLVQVTENFDIEIGNISRFDAIVKALSYEISTEEIYSRITDYDIDKNIKDLFFRLWATSTNEYKKALINELKSEINLEQNSNMLEQVDNNLNLPFLKSFIGKEGYDEIVEIFNKFSNGKADSKDIQKLLNNSNMSLFSGLVAGSLGGILLKDFLEEK